MAKSIINSSLQNRNIRRGRELGTYCAGYADANFKIDCLDVYISSEAGQIQVCKDGFGLLLRAEGKKSCSKMKYS